MKKQLISRILATALIATAAWLAAGCEKENVTQNAPSDLQRLPGRFKQVLTLHDGASKVTLGISSDDSTSLSTFESNLSMVATAEKPTDADNFAAESTNPSSENTYAEEHAVHITVLDEELVTGMEGFKLVVNTPEIAGKVNSYGTYSGGPYYFYSWEAPHYFKVTPISGHCVSAWLYQAGSTWSFVSWAGGSGGNYLCYNFWAASSNVNSLDYRLKAQGSYFSVYWY